MKINAKTTSKNRNVKLTKIRKFYLKGKIKLEKILFDMFEKTKKGNDKIILHDGDTFQRKLIKTRDIPNCISTADDTLVLI